MRRHVSAVILYGSFSRGDFHEGSDVDLIVAGDVRERFHKAGRQPSSSSRSSRSATPGKSSPNWSGVPTRSSTRHWPKASGCRWERSRDPGCSWPKGFPGR
ncbi:nucleotidyltransferase domain-containing protein [Methanoculleus sp. 10]|uniref:nucleotidyltransferase family protein n=1 Tax=Methanoculleus sp. 10 TaxID=430615 RepID=UPI0025DBB460|nr:nucleotidyltransferase domain-containing protein [Methanoculleus sp. 10]MDD3934624.1 nucleotidyltransferase domain-containing protein [Methanoculleus sp.]